MTGLRSQVAKTCRVERQRCEAEPHSITIYRRTLTHPRGAPAHVARRRDTHDDVDDKIVVVNEHDGEIW